MVSGDEVACIGLIAAAQRGLPGQQAKSPWPWSVRSRAAELAAHATRLADVLAEAGHVLSPPASAVHPTLH